MTRISLSKIHITKLLPHRLGWKTLALGSMTIISFSVWQLSIARHGPSVSDKTSSATSRPANDLNLRESYDLSSINADSSYYQRVDALRLYQTAPIPDGHKRHEELRIVGEAYRLALPQSWSEQPLVVLAKPGRPVTFVALDSGKFPNDDISITIKADGRGLASTYFFVTNEGRYRVLAGSPENAGQAAFYVNCMSQTMRDDVRSGRYAKRYLSDVKANKKRQEAAAAEVLERIRLRRTMTIK